MKNIYIFLFFLFVPSFFCFGQSTVNIDTSQSIIKKHLFCYTNPITRDTSIAMRDHYIIKVDKYWYCTGTSMPVWTGHNPGVRLLISNDLITWRHYSWLIDSSTLPIDCPYNGRFWAPEIHFIKNKFWLTVNSGKVTHDDPKGMKTHSIWLFSSDKITGPFKLINGPLTPQYNNDATLFEDEDGQTYLYCSGNGLFQAKIDLSSGKIVGTLQKFLSKNEPGNPDWMIGGIEGPFVIKKDGIYFMFFSSWTRGYEVGLLKSNTPLGPWELASREPIFGTRKKEYRRELAVDGGYSNLQFRDSDDPYCETGHNSLFEGPDGKLWNSCHYLIFNRPSAPINSKSEEWEKTPQLGIEPVYYKNGMFYINGPTWKRQCVEY
jgi:xylan 1,4-beta-xylosidase